MGDFYEKIFLESYPDAKVMGYLSLIKSQKSFFEKLYKTEQLILVFTQEPSNSIYGMCITPAGKVEKPQKMKYSQIKLKDNKHIEICGSSSYKGAYQIIKRLHQKQREKMKLVEILDRGDKDVKGS